MKGGVFEIAHVLNARADTTTGMVTYQTGDVHSGEVYDDAVVAMQAHGLISMPAPPAPGLSAPEAIVLKTGGSDIAIAGRSVRSGEIAGLVKMGESCVFADGSRASTLYKLDGSITNYTTHDNSVAGRSVYTSTSPDGFDCSTPWARFTVGSLGVHAHCVRSDGSSGAYFDFGSVAGLPAPFDSMGTYLAMGANLVRVEGGTIILGTDAGAVEPVAKATTLVAVLATLATALSDLSVSMTALASPTAPLGTTSTPPIPVIATPPFAALLATTVASISTATAAIATASAGATPGPVLSLTSANVTVT